MNNSTAAQYASDISTTMTIVVASLIGLAVLALIVTVMVIAAFGRKRRK